MSDLMCEMEDDLRRLGKYMLDVKENGFGVCLQGGLKDGTVLMVQVVEVKDGKVLNARI